MPTALISKILMLRVIPLFALAALTAAGCGTVELTTNNVEETLEERKEELGPCQEIGADDVNGGATLSKGCYTAVENLGVAEGTLTIEAGAWIEFEQGLAMGTSGTGRIKAEGATDDPIRLTGTEQVRGYWMGVNIETRSTDNVFKHVELAYAGSGQWHGGGESVGAIRVADSGKLVVEDSTITESGRYALFIEGANADISGFARNTVTSNARAGLLYADHVGDIERGNRFVGNDLNVIQVSMSNGDTISSDQTWHDHGVPYRIMDRTYVTGDWSIAAGVTVEARQSTPLIVTAGGKIMAAGEATSEVRFTGVEEIQGFWMGLLILSNVDNELRHTIVEYAGSDQWHGGGESVAALKVGDAFGETGKLTLDETTVAESGGYGLYLGNGSFTCTNVTFNNNARGDAYDSTTDAVVDGCP